MTFVRIVALEVQDVANVRAPEFVNALVGIAHDAQVPVRFGEHADEQVLDVVRILVLVDQNVAEPLLKPLQHVRPPLEQVDRLQQKVVEVHGVGVEQFPLVGLVHPRDLALPKIRSAVRIPLGTDSFVLRPADGGK